MPLARLLLFCPMALLCLPVAGQRHLNSGIVVPVQPDPVGWIWFDRALREWDGFGVNYVEACQTRDYGQFPQDYSGFSFAGETSREQILELIFGPEGLKPGLTKLFLDPFHGKLTGENNKEGLTEQVEYDHTTTTRWMRYFNREGQRKMDQWGGKLTAIATLYAPPAWMTRQKTVLGRDLDPDRKYACAEYMASWVAFLREEEGLNVRYLSLHNEGDAYYRWPRDGNNPGEDHRDYNLYWSPGQVVDLLKITRKVLDDRGLLDVGMTPGETQNWYRFDQWGYATAIATDKTALASLGLITSHSFAFLENIHSIYYGDYRSTGQDLITALKPELHIWVTSRPWSEGPEFINNIRRDIYESKANGIIPWALISGAGEWLQENGTYSDGSMNAAFLIDRAGGMRVLDGYYFYKQVSRAGQPGSVVAQVASLDPSIGLIAFAGADSGNPDSFVLINNSREEKKIEISLHGTPCRRFSVFRSSGTEKYAELGERVLGDDGHSLLYTAPARSVSTFLGLLPPQVD